MRRLLWPALAVGCVVVGVALLAAEPVRFTVARWLDPPAVADRGAVVAQREAATHALARGYVKAFDQLRSTGNVRLPVSAAQATAIRQKAEMDLGTVRRAALADLAQASGATGADATAYVAATEAKLDGASSFAEEPGTLLAPAFFAIVSRADALFAQISDQATRELTTAPAAPSPTR